MCYAGLFDTGTLNTFRAAFGVETSVLAPDTELAFA
jgi:hypothetical protein